MFPITPHLCEFMWLNDFKKVKGTEDKADLLSNHTWPDIKKENIDFKTLDSYDYL
jgi:hypothetical protein